LRRDADRLKQSKKIKKPEVEGQKKGKIYQLLNLLVWSMLDSAANRLSQQLKCHNLTQRSTLEATGIPITDLIIFHKNSSCSLIFKV
jgi:hypothetical protein